MGIKVVASVLVKMVKAGNIWSEWTRVCISVDRRLGLDLRIRFFWPWRRGRIFQDWCFRHWRSWQCQVYQKNFLTKPPLNEPPIGSRKAVAVHFKT